MTSKQNGEVKNGIIIFENIEILTAGQRDQFAEFLIDFNEGFLEINDKPLKLPGNVMIILRTRDLKMLESWRYVSQTPLKTLKPIPIK